MLVEENLIWWVSKF